MSRNGRFGGLVGEMGPGWLAGAIAAGPATMASLLSAGAGYGFALLWAVVLATVLGVVAQYLSMRLGLLSAGGIVSTVETHLGGGWAWFLVVDAVLAAGLAQLVIMKGLADVTAALTGLDPRLVGIGWAVVLAVGLAGGGYRVAELGAKVLVAGVVVAFVAALAVVPVDAGAAVAGLRPTLPPGGALLVAAILGGAVHVTLVTMHTYTVQARGWTREDHRLATADVVGSMGIAFGAYSLAIFLVAASVLVGTPGLTSVEAGRALAPVAGAAAQWLFLVGLLGAAVSTLGGNTVVPPYLLADRLGWALDVSDGRYRALLAATALGSAAGAFLGGAFFPLLVLVISFGLIATPFALAVVLYLLNDPEAVERTNGPAANVAGGVLLAVVVWVNVARLREQVSVSGAASAVDLFVLAFAVVTGVATLVVLGKLVTRGRRSPAGPARDAELE
ncbi:NRAMP family divalent metal transporter [Halomarina ordinaria]|uniref:NRAMP family divalent metal transporter n=1 Tax=Halomarina ordinaria TaxID=3033939 RepID=A0ABD5U8L8_9EURY|nr:divalent metal cation transporter [Halomarina sp. PSRA2]